MFENKPLSTNERKKLNPYYLEVVNHYEKTTKRAFTKDELVVLKLLIEITTPAAINMMISKLFKGYPDNFKTLSYIYQPTKNFFKNKKRSN
jgi:hypothetical protein